MLAVVLAVALALGGTSSGATAVVARPTGAAPTDGPTVPLGTGATLVLTTIAESDTATGFPLTVTEGAPVVVALYLPDRSPERTLGADQLPAVSVEAPDGSFVRSAADEREPTTAVVAGETMVQVASLEVPLPAGEAIVAVTGPTPARVAVRVLPADTPASPASVDDAMATWLDTPPTPVSTTSPEGDLDLSRLAGPRYDDSSPGRAAGLPLALGAVAIMGVVVVLVVRARGHRRGGPPADQLQDGSGG